MSSVKRRPFCVGINMFRLYATRYYTQESDSSYKGLKELPIKPALFQTSYASILSQSL